MSYDNWKLTEPYDPSLDAEDESPATFICSCGDPECVGYSDDAANLKIGKTWYAADCVMANHHPEVVRGRELEAIYDRSRR